MSRTNVGLNISGGTGYDCTSVYLADLMELSSGFFDPSNGGAPFAVDAHGWPTTVPDAAHAPTNLLALNAYLPAGTYPVTANGAGTIRFATTGVGGYQDCVFDGSGTPLAITTTGGGGEGAQWGCQIVATDPGNHLRDVRVMLPDSTSSRFSAAFLAYLAPFACLRMVDWQSANSNSMVNWTDRAIRTAHFTVNGRGSIDYETICALANETGKDLWLHIPYGASDDYCTQMGAFFDANLNAGIRIYVEYANECWNYGNSAKWGYLIAQSSNPTDPPYVQCNGNSYALIGLRMGHTMQLFKDAVTSGRRVTRVVGGQSGNYGGVTRAFTDTLDGHGYSYEAVGTAPYVGSIYTPNSTAYGSDPAAELTHLFSGVPSYIDDGIVPETVLHIDHYCPLGKEVLFYECGSGLLGGGPDVPELVASQLDARIGTYYDDFSAKVNALPATHSGSVDLKLYYHDCGPWNVFGLWGHRRGTYVEPPGVKWTTIVAEAAAGGGASTVGNLLSESFSGTAGSPLVGQQATPTNYGSDAWFNGYPSYNGAFAYVNGGGVTSSALGSNSIAVAEYALTGATVNQRVTLGFSSATAGGHAILITHRDGESTGHGFTYDFGFAGSYSIGQADTNGTDHLVANGTVALAHDGSTHTLVATLIGTSLSVVLDGMPLGASPFTVQPMTGTNLWLIQGGGSAGDVVFKSLAVRQAAAILSGPTSGTPGAPSGAFTVTLDGAAPAGGQAVTLASSAGGSAFAGARVSGTTLTIPAGQTTGTFTYARSGAGTSNISIASTGLAVGGSPVAYAASTGGATAFTLSGPSTGTVGVASANFTFTPTGGGYTGTITPAMAGLAGTWSPSTLTWSAASNALTAKFTASASGSGTANGSGSPTLTTPAGVAFAASAAAATSYTLTGPSGGAVGSPSAAFTVTPVGGPFTGPVTVTPSGGGLSTPIVKTFAGSATAQTFTITPTSAGTVTLTPTNGGGLANPSAMSYVASAASTRNQLQAGYPGASLGTIYFVVLDPSARAWDGTSFGALDASHWPNYAIAGADAAGVRIYLADFPAAIPAGAYTAYAYRRVGGAPDPSDPVVGGPWAGSWDGTSFGTAAAGDGLARVGAIRSGETGYQSLRKILAEASGEWDVTTAAGFIVYRLGGQEVFRTALPGATGRPEAVNGGGL